MLPQLVIQKSIELTDSSIVLQSTAWIFFFFIFRRVLKKTQKTECKKKVGKVLFEKLLPEDIKTLAAQSTPSAGEMDFTMYEHSCVVFSLFFLNFYTFLIGFSIFSRFWTGLHSLHFKEVSHFFFSFQMDNVFHTHQPTAILEDIEITKVVTPLTCYSHCISHFYMGHSSA